MWVLSKKNYLTILSRKFLFIWSARTLSVALFFQTGILLLCTLQGTIISIGYTCKKNKLIDWSILKICSVLKWQPLVSVLLLHKRTQISKTSIINYRKTNHLIRKRICIRQNKRMQMTNTFHCGLLLNRVGSLFYRSLCKKGHNH